jgi:iron complex outermembrane receptor protein
MSKISQTTVSIMLGMLVVQAPPALSQDAPAVEGLEEVIVSARKRVENLIDVPLSITAIGSDQIEKTGINSVADIANQTPGLSFRPAFGRVGSGQGGGSSNRPTLRGQSNILGIPNVGFFVDGVFVAGNITSYQLDNVERIEVIRGPQSALFGRGTFAGAMNFVTRKPGQEVTGKIEATAGFNELKEIEGYVSGPLLGETLSGEVNFRYYERNGDWLNRATGKKDGGAEETQNIGAKLYWTPNERFNAELNLGYSVDNDGTFAAGYTGLNCFAPTIISAPTAAIPVSSTRRRGYYCGEVNIDNRHDFFSRTDILNNLGLEGVDRDTFRSSIKTNLAIGEWTLTGIGAYNTFRNQNSFDSGFENAEATLRPIGLSSTEDSRKDWSAELRLDSPTDRRLHGLVGAYYYREDDGDGYASGFVLPMTGGVPLGSSIVTFNGATTQNDSAVKNWSVFGLLEFKVNDRLKLTAEGRYQVDTIISDQLTLASNRTNVLLEKDFKKFLPRVTALYEMTPNWNLFANIAEGNKPGGFNGLPANASAASLAQLQAQFQSFAEESARTYELGIKGGNESRTIQLSASIYQIDWDSQQLTLPFIYTTNAAVPVSANSTAIVNAGQTQVRGAEIDLSYRPLAGLTFRFAYALVDAKIVDFNDFETEDLYDTDGRVGAFDVGPDPNGQVAGAQLPQSPKHQVILSGDYRRQLTDNIKGFVRGDLTMESKRYDQVHNLAHTGQSELLNIRTGIEFKDLTVSLWVDNALDDRTPASLTRLLHFGRAIQVPSFQNPAVNQTTFFRDIMISFPRKRSYGMTVRYNF